MNESIEESKSYIFTYENGKIVKQIDNKRKQFILFPSNKEKLFQFGENELVVFKSNRKDESVFKLSEMNNVQTFTPRRFVVIQMM